ncbi:MAG: IclR family transcriptional regulator [Chloroflexi bacterium]|nr:MAG: IclR family transcriptional regulator [Chloroflexota bacterium]
MARELHIEGFNSLTPDVKGDVLQTVQRALRVLSLVAEHPRGLTVRQISAALDLNISTCYHLLNTLVVSGYLDRPPHQQIYLLGPQIPYLNNAFVQGVAAQETASQMEGISWPPGWSASWLVGQLRAMMYRLTEQTQEPSYLSCWRFGEVLLLAIVEAPRAPKVTGLYVGYQGPAHCHALGKVLLAYSDPAFVDRYLDVHPLTSIGPNTIVQRLRFQEELNDIVRQGYSIDKEEFSADTYCIAAPIFAPKGEVVAGLAISFSGEVFAKRVEWLIAQVTRAANYARAELRLAPAYQL